MLDLDNIRDEFDYIFFIASFHHLDNLDNRMNVLKKVKRLLKDD
jgi:SAM-dependent methyltransferase